MKIRLGFLLLTALMSFGCGSSETCFTPNPNDAYIDRDAIFVANTGSNSVSAFQSAGPAMGAGGVCGSPFAVGGPPTALGGGTLAGSLFVASQAQRTVSTYSVDFLTSVLTGPVFTISTRYTPVAVAALEGFFYLANAEGGISAYQVVNGTGATEIAGSPFASGSGPVALVGGFAPPVLRRQLAIQQRVGLRHPRVHGCADAPRGIALRRRTGAGLDHIDPRSSP